jgi:hypothetical protein
VQIELQLTQPSTSLYDGLPFHITVDPPGFDQNPDALIDLPPFMLDRYRLHCIQRDAVSLIIRTVRFDSTAYSDLLNSLMENFDNQLLQTSLSEADGLGGCPSRSS